LNLLSINIYKDVISSDEPTTLFLHAYSKPTNDDSCSPNANIAAAVSGVSLALLAVIALLLVLMRRYLKIGHRYSYF
jgi:hypothetical protein